MFELKHIFKEFGEKTLFDDVDLTLSRGDVAAIIGENGAGKTTLLEMISGKVDADSGNINLFGGVIGYVPQDLEPNSDQTVREVLTDRSLSTDHPLMPEWRMKYALSMIGLSDIALDMTTRSLSGGQKTRLSLAKILSRDSLPDILLLDEPTNNIDNEGLVWLIEFIKKFTGIVILVSHNRDFINLVANKIILIDDQKFKTYSGNYDDFKHESELENSRKMTEYQEYTHELNRLQRLRQQKASTMQSVSSGSFDKMKHGDKMLFNSRRSGAQASIGQKMRALDSRISQLDKAERPKFKKRYRIKLNGSIESDKLVLRVSSLTKSYTDPLFSELSFDIRGAKRIAITGPNGAGKTTLLKIIKGEVVPDSGEIKLGANIKLGYFSQEIYGLDNNKTGLENLQTINAPDEIIFQQVRSLGLNISDLKKPLVELSRGQLAKIGFAKLMMSDFDLLILDEPTNHLDIPTKEHIECALQEYGGAILLASHDEYFLRNIKIDHVIELKKDR